MTKTIFILLLTFLIAGFSFSEEFDYSNIDGDLFLTDIPEYLGEAAFIEKVNQKGGGKPPLGLVFSGGAARAFAHIGVLKKLEEENIFPDFIVANSMGSIVALLYAAGVSPDMIQQMMLDYNTEDLFRPVIPLNGGVLDSGRFISILYEILGDLDLSVLKIPVAIISEDLVSRRQIVFMEGDFYKILQGSISMPFSFPPVPYKDMMLIDGGVTNLVPIDVAAKYTDRIIVSTALYDRESSFRSFTTVLNRAFDIGKTRKGVNQLKTFNPLIIRCDVEGYSFMAFQKIDEIVDKGYQSAEEVISRQKESFSGLKSYFNQDRISQLEEERASVADSYEIFRKKYSKTGAIPSKHLSASFSAGFRMYSGPEDDYNLNNLDYLYVGQNLEYGYIQSSVSEYWSGENSGVDSKINFILFDLLRFKNRALFNWDSWEYDYSYYHTRGDLHFSPTPGTEIMPFTSYEGNYDTAFLLDKGFVKSGIDTFAGDRDLFLSLFWFGEGSSFPDEMVSGWGGKNNFKLKFSDYFGLRQKTSLRIPFSDSDEIGLFRNDGLRGVTVSGDYERVLVTNNNFSFMADADLTLGEILILKDVEASVFVDYFERDEAGISTGLALDFDISFIGLTSFYFAAFGGYDWLSEGIFIGVAVSSRE